MGNYMDEYTIVFLLTLALGLLLFIILLWLVDNSGDPWDLGR